MFSSIFTESITIYSMLIMILSSIMTGIISSYILSYAIKSSKRFFVATSLMGVTIAIIVAFVNGENVGLGAGVAIGGAFSLTRFRSAQGSSEELGAILISSASGIAFGMGYIAYGVLISILLSLIMLVVSKTNLFNTKSKRIEKLVKVTIPEDVNYEEVFKDVFESHSTEYEYISVKTSDMGSLFKVSIKVILKPNTSEKELLDELRIRNSNLEVQISPYIESNQAL